MSNFMGKKKSVIWKYFTPVTETIAVCNLCRRKISYRSSSSNLKKHIKCRHKSVSFATTGPTNRRQLLDLLDEQIDCSDITDPVEIEIMQDDNLVEINGCEAETLEQPVTVDSQQEIHEERQEEEVAVNNLEDGTSANNNINVTSQNNSFQKNNINSPNPRIERIFLQNRKKIWEEFKIKNDHQYQKSSQNQMQPSTGTVSPTTVKEDSYDFFGKYVASMLREVGPPISLALQEEIISLVLRKRCFLD